MPRVSSSVASRRRRKRILKRASGFYGAGSRRLRTAKTLLYKAGTNATRDRKRKKRDFRRLWVTRISAACGQRGGKYSEFMNGLFHADIDLNRKMLSEIAIDDPDAFTAVYEKAMEARNAAQA